MSNSNFDKKSRKLGRTPVWPEPTTDISRRLHQVLPKIGMIKIGELFFDNMSDKGVSSILSGKTEPPPSALLRISTELGVDLNWLAWGEEREANSITSPPARASGDKAVDHRDLVIRCLAVQERLSRLARALSGDEDVDVDVEMVKTCSSQIQALARTLATLASKSKDRRIS